MRLGWRKRLSSSIPHEPRARRSKCLASTETIMTRLIVLLLLSALATSCTSTPESISVESLLDELTPWSEPVNGIKVRLVPLSSEYREEDEIELRLEIANTTDHELHLAMDFDPIVAHTHPGTHDYNVKITKSMPQVFRSWAVMSTQARPISVSILPHSRARVSLLALGNLSIDGIRGLPIEQGREPVVPIAFLDREKDGHHTFTCIIDLKDDGSPSTWSGSIETPPVTIHIESNADIRYVPAKSYVPRHEPTWVPITVSPSRVSGQLVRVTPEQVGDRRWELRYSWVMFGDATLGGSMDLIVMICNDPTRDAGPFAGVEGAVCGWYGAAWDSTEEVVRARTETRRVDLATSKPIVSAIPRAADGRDELIVVSLPAGCGPQLVFWVTDPPWSPLIPK